jgi:type I restriction enzyme S subunit
MMDVKPLKEIASFIRTGKTPPTKEEKYFNGKINWYSPGDLDKTKYLFKAKRTITELAIIDKKAITYPKNTLLIGCIGDIGKLGITSELCSSNQQLTGVLPNDNTDVNYLYYWFQGNKKVLESYSNNAVVPILNNRNLETVKIPLPPLEQQKKIAAILDTADAYRQKTKALITKYDALTQSLFLDMFGDPVRNPKGWEMKPLKEFGKIVTGNTPSRKNDANYNNKFIEWIKTNNITSEFTNVTTAKEYLSEEGLLNSRSVNKGSLLVACIAGSINSIGRAALTDRKVAFNQQINAIEPFKNISSIFLYYLFKSSSSYIQSHASNGMKRMLSKGDFQKIKMICPNIDIQNQFAERAKAIEAQKTQAQASLVQADNLFNSLLQRAFKGELV